MPYRVVLIRKSQKDLKNADSRFRIRILASLAAIAANPFHAKKLWGEHKGEYSYRVWPYRIIYRIKERDRTVLITRIGHRQGAY